MHMGTHTFYITCLPKVSFSNNTSTEDARDYITIFKDQTRTSFWGNKKRLSGPRECGWPGANGRPPLMIPSDRVVIQFHTDHSVEDWGFKVTLQVCMHIQSTQFKNRFIS